MATSFINLDQIVRDWAWRQYDATATKKQRQLREKEKKKQEKYLEVVLDWSEVKARDETHWPHLAEDNVTEEENQNTVQTVAEAGDSGSPRRGKEQADTYTPTANVVFQTKFTNNTKDDQEYTLKTEKTTHSSCSVEVERGFTHGVELSVTLKTPGEIFEANAGYKREVSLTNTEGQTFEEELVWGVESKIQVKAEHIAEAQLVVNEKKYSGDFVIETQIRGYVYVTFTNLRDNNSFVKMVSGDIVTILSEYVQKEQRKGISLEYVEFKDKDKEKIVCIKSAGKCKFHYGINQEINVNQKPL